MKYEPPDDDYTMALYRCIEVDDQVDQVMMPCLLHNSSNDQLYATSELP